MIAGYTFIGATYISARYTGHSAPRKGQILRLVTPTFNITMHSCLQFQLKHRYLDLVVYTYNLTNTEVFIVKLHDREAPLWHMVQADVQPGVVGFVFSFENQYFGNDLKELNRSGIDNITVIERPCNHGMLCSFYYKFGYHSYSRVSVDLIL